MQNSTPDDNLVHNRLAPILGDTYPIMRDASGGDYPVDLFLWPPTDEHPMWTVVTSGAHRYKMTTPEGFEDFSRFEYVMTLPPLWQATSINKQYEEEDEAAYWPLHLLHVIPQMVIEYDSWFSYGHTVQAGQELSDTFAGTDFCGVVLGGPISIDADFDLLATPYHGEKVHFLGLYPIYLREMVFAMEDNGVELLKKLNDADVYEGLILDRRPVM